MAKHTNGKGLDNENLAAKPDVEVQEQPNPRPLRALRRNDNHLFPVSKNTAHQIMIEMESKRHICEPRRQVRDGVRVDEVICR
jgi:hypothetical protein